MAPNDGAVPQVIPPGGEALWFLGTFTQVKLDAAATGGRLGAAEVLAPHGAAPPLHSHPQDETFYVLDGEITAWLVDVADTADTAWVAEAARRCGPGAMVYAPGGTPHTFRVESDSARILVLSTPGGIEDYMRGLSEPAAWPWLPPPPDGPRVSAERMAEVEERLGFVRHGPPPPPA